jgi:hypothetical protein
LLAFTLLVWLLRRDRPFAPSNLLFLLISTGLVVLYQSLPPWATFVPVLSGIIFTWGPGRRMPNLILSGTLAAAVLGSAIFANPVLFRAILMTDWLFVLYFVAAVWFPAEILSRRLAGAQFGIAGTEEDETSSFQNALSLLSRRSCLLLVIVTLGFFLFSGARLIALSASHHREKGKTQSSPGWSLRRDLTVPEKLSILQRLQRSPFSILPEDPLRLPIYQGGKDLPNVGDYIVEIGGFYYDYYIPPGKTLPYRMLGFKPYARTLVRLSRFEFIFTEEIPADFADRPLVFVGAVVPPEVDDREQSLGPLVRGLAIVPLGGNGRPDFAHAICAPPACD